MNKIIWFNTRTINRRLLIIFSAVTTLCYAQKEIPSRSIIANEDLESFLKPKVKAQLRSENYSLAEYYRNKFRERYFYDWRSNPARVQDYKDRYSNQATHQKRATDHMDKYIANTQWKLPFNYSNGKPVNAYALRHLARQHKMIDIAMLQKLDGNSEDYISYFTVQMQSLNNALSSNKYEKIKDGNGVYEAFRSGYRVLNWLKIHNLFLDEQAYSNADQLTTIATLLQHGQHLFEQNQKYKSGNHQTRGMSALAMLAILFQDFEGTDQWYKSAMNRLEKHLIQEINNDGFQFERSVHYHMSDINNYYYVYRLAKINKMKISATWENRLKLLFTTLVKIAYPDKSAPVLQDDTDNPWAEKNNIRKALTLGYLLFGNPEIGYYANSSISAKMYWHVNQKQLNSLQDIKVTTPSFGSLYFQDTKYYVMREGYEKQHKMMIISAGVNMDKPDHQHGDILGLQAMAYGKVILPNYQVRYSLPDYEFFKNSMVKNVALVDDLMLGEKYKGNKGGSGFGKFKQLPTPNPISWISNDTYDFFSGSHDGFEQIGVNYARQIIYVKDHFWIVKDNFKSDSIHTYKQVWQGHFSQENKARLIRCSFDDATGCDIFQLNDVDSFYAGGIHGKQWNVITKQSNKSVNFITIIYPYKGYNKGIDISSQKVGSYRLNSLPFDAIGENIVSLSKGDQSYLFQLEGLVIEGQKFIFDKKFDGMILVRNNELVIQSLDTKSINIFGPNDTNLISLSPGSKFTYKLK